MEHLTEPTLLAFLLQVLAFTAYIPLSYIAYRWVRVPLKREWTRQALAQLGIADARGTSETLTEYTAKDYVWPILFALAVNFGVFASTHSYILYSGLSAGLVEVTSSPFGVDSIAERAALVTRVFYWAFLGAALYSFHMTFRRFLAYDLTPSVYIFIANRLILAFSVGGITGLGIGTYATATGVPFDINLITVGLIVFFIGFFPEQGINWITATAQKALKQQGGISKETHLAEVEGLSIWHQGRLKQEGIENIQNLAAADIPALVVGTPFTLNQIIDWIDQAILLAHTSDPQFQSLERAGITRASDILTVVDDNKSLTDMAEASGLKKSELKLLFKTLQSALNIKLITRFRWQASLNPRQVSRAAAIKPTQLPLPVTSPAAEPEAARKTTEVSVKGASA